MPEPHLSNLLQNYSILSCPKYCSIEKEARGFRSRPERIADGRQYHRRLLKDADQFTNWD